MSETRRIPLDRRVLVVRRGRIDLRPERGAVIFPLAGLLISAALFASVVLFAGDLSATLLVLILLPGLLLAPFATMGLVYSVIGAAVVVEKEKQSVCFQQGVLGLGIGTMDLVPFWKIDNIVVEDFEQGIVAPGPHPLDFRAWDIVLVKVSGKRLPIAQVIAGASGDLIEEGWDRALDAAEAIAEMTGSRVVITAEIELEEPVKPASESGRGRASVSAEAEILRKYHTIAVVGLSNDETRVSHSVSKYMQSAGYRIVPVSPVETEVLGEKAYRTVASIPAPAEIVNVFRRPKAVPGVVDDAIAAGAKVIWMQEGIVNEEAAAKARRAGLEVVMDRCIRSEHRRMVASA